VRRFGLGPRQASGGLRAAEVRGGGGAGPLLSQPLLALAQRADPASDRRHLRAPRPLDALTDRRLDRPATGRPRPALAGRRRAVLPVLDRAEQGAPLLPLPLPHLYGVQEGRRDGVELLRRFPPPLQHRLGVDRAPPRGAPDAPAFSPARDDAYEACDRYALALTERPRGLEPVAPATGAVTRPPRPPIGGIRMKLSIDNCCKFNGFMLLSQALSQGLRGGSSFSRGLDRQTLSGSTGALQKAVQVKLGLKDRLHPTLC
jgi:hypothetical protein